MQSEQGTVRSKTRTRQKQARDACLLYFEECALSRKSKALQASKVRHQRGSASGLAKCYVSTNETLHVTASNEAKPCATLDGDIKETFAVLFLIDMIQGVYYAYRSKACVLC